MPLCYWSPRQDNCTLYQPAGDILRGEPQCPRSAKSGHRPTRLPLRARSSRRRRMCFTFAFYGSRSIGIYRLQGVKQYLNSLAVLGEGVYPEGLGVGNSNLPAPTNSFQIAAGLDFFAAPQRPSPLAQLLHALAPPPHSIRRLR